MAPDEIDMKEYVDQLVQSKVQTWTMLWTERVRAIDRQSDVVDRLVKEIHELALRQVDATIYHSDINKLHDKIDELEAFKNNYLGKQRAYNLTLATVVTVVNVGVSILLHYLH